MSKDFPLVIFGKCQECGQDGRDYPAASLTTADAQGNLKATGNGVQLEYYEGRYICELCKNTITSDKESLESARKHANSELFRQRAGFTNSI
jgi:hypothetical protein